MRLLSRLLSLWKHPTHLEEMQAELIKAKFALSEAETGKEYATAMVEYNTKRIARLESKIANSYTE